MVLLITEIVPGRGNKIYGHDSGPLMKQLEKRMLAIGAGLTPENGSSIVIHWFTVEAGGLAVALHIQLLKVGGQQQQALAIGYNCRGLQLEEIAVPDAK